MVERTVPPSLAPSIRAHRLTWPQKLSLCWLTSIAVVALLGLWVGARWEPQGLAEALSARHDDGQLWRWWIGATRNSAVGLFVVVGASLVFGIGAASAGAFGPWWVGAGLTRALELTGALPNVILVGLWLVTHREDALGAVVVVVAMQRTFEVASVAWLALRTLDNQRLAHSAGPIPNTLAWHRPLVSQLRSLLATSAAHGAASLFALQAAVVYLGLAAADDSTWASLLGRAARHPEQVDWALVWVAAVSTCTVTLSLFAVAAGPARPTPSPRPARSLALSPEQWSPAPGELENSDHIEG